MPPRCFYLMLLATATSAFAQGDGERAALARLAGEIDQLAPLLKQAEAQTDPKDRVHFSYGWLREDLVKVKAGIRVHLDWTGPAPSPRPSSRCAGSILRWMPPCSPVSMAGRVSIPPGSGWRWPPAWLWPRSAGRPGRDLWNQAD